MIIIILTFIIGAMPAPGVQEIYRFEGESVFDLAASPDLGHWYCIAIHPSNGYRLTADGKPGPWFDEIDQFKVVYSKDGAHLAYVATREGRQVMVRDGQEGKEYDQICGEYEWPRYSEDGEHLVYSALDNNRYLVVRDGKESKPYNGIRPPVFSPDGKHMAFAGRLGERWTVVLDGKDIRECDNAQALQFTPDGSLTYTVQENGQWFLIHGSTKGPAYDEISDIRSSRDGRHCAYAARTGEKWRVVLDGKPGKEYDHARNLEFSSSGKRLAYAAGFGDWVYDGYWDYNRFDGSYAAILDGQELCRGKEGYDIEYFSFSADEAHLAYVIGKIAESSQLVVDTAPGPSFHGIRYLGYAPAGERLVCNYYQRGDSHFVAVGDQTWGPYFDSQYPLFSRDGDRIAYAFRRGSDWRVAIEGVEQDDAFDRISNLQVSSDGKSCGLIGVRDGKIMRAVYSLE